jgi:hypothetical protein
MPVVVLVGAERELLERGHPVRQRAQHAQSNGMAISRRCKAVRAARSGGQDVRAPFSWRRYRPVATAEFSVS